jgi:hypothetical protein
MGGPLSRVLADLVIEEKVEKVISNHPKWGEMWDWCRLIDDTLSKWPSKEEFLEFHNFINTLHPTIKWTYETEEENKLAIFDVLIIKKEDELETTVYRKETATNRYIHWTSAQAPKEKINAMKTLKNRALAYCSNPQLLADELTTLQDIFHQNGYPPQLVKRILFRDSIPPKEEEIDLNRTFYAPYHRKAEKMFKTIQDKFNLQIIFKKTQTLGQLLKKRNNTKHTLSEKEVVYKIPCAQCQTSYIGQTKQILGKRLTQHANNCNKKTSLKTLKANTNDNGVAYHHKLTNHNFDFENTVILQREKNETRRKVAEALHIKSSTNLANLQAGLELDECWTPFLTNPT